MQTQSHTNACAPRHEARRKRFDSVSSPPTSNQALPLSIPPAAVHPRPDLGGDCWNSPLCPRNMAASGVPSNLIPTDCGPAKSPQIVRTTSAATEICSPAAVITIQANPRQDASDDRIPAKRIKPNPDSDHEDNLTPADPSPSSSTNPNKAQQPEKRLPHHIIERRYRENLNTSIETLRAAVPTTTSCLTLDMEDIGAANPQSSGIRPLSKAAVIGHAAEYMRTIAAQNEEVERANRELRVTVEALRRLVNCEDCGVVQRIVNAGTGAC